MIANETAWKVVASFCETIMVQKEAAERNRERADPCSELREGDGVGGARRGFGNVRLNAAQSDPQVAGHVCVWGGFAE